MAYESADPQERPDGYTQVFAGVQNYLACDELSIPILPTSRCAWSAAA